MTSHGCLLATRGQTYCEFSLFLLTKLLQNMDLTSKYERVSEGLLDEFFLMTSRGQLFSKSMEKDLSAL